MHEKHGEKVVPNGKKLSHVKSGSEATHKVSHSTKKHPTWELADEEALPGVETSNNLDITDGSDVYRFGVRFGGHEAYYTAKTDQQLHIRAFREFAEKLTKGLLKKTLRQNNE
jgi:hypothetical protein